MGSIDSRFNISKQEARSVIAAAASAWNSAYGRQILVEQSDASLPINFQFGQAQAFVQTAEGLKAQGLDLEMDVQTFNKHQESLNRDIKAVNRESESLALEIQNFTEQLSEWNSQTVKPRIQYEILVKERDIVERRRSELTKKQKDLQEESQLMSRWRSIIEQQRESHSLEWDVLKSIQNNNIEFKRAGVFRESLFSKSITIYVYANHRALKTLIMHEFGHALGLSHLASSSALMYPELQENNMHLQSPTRADVEALKSICA